MRIRKTPLKELTIDRSKWANNSTKEALGNSELLNEEGNMCCLGFYAKACGFTDASIQGVAVPSRLSRNTKETVPGLTNSVYTDSDGFSRARATDLSDEAISINDSTYDTNSRERALKALFKAHGTKVKFVGRYPKGI